MLHGNLIFSTDMIQIITVVDPGFPRWGASISKGSARSKLKDVGRAISATDIAERS